MVSQCKRLHAENPKRSREALYYFAGLEPYEAAAEGAYERWRKEQRGQLSLALREERKCRWDTYREARIAEAELSFDTEAKAELERVAEAIVRGTQDGASIRIPGVLRKLIDVERRKLILQQLGALSEEAFYEALEVDESFSNASPVR